MRPVLRAYVATNWNTVLKVTQVIERPAPRASGREFDTWALCEVDNNGGTPHWAEVPLNEAFVRIFNPDADLTTPRFLSMGDGSEPPTYCTREQIIEHFRRRMLADRG